VIDGLFTKPKTPRSSIQTDQVNVGNFTFQIQHIISCPDTEDPLPGVHDNYDILWLLCGGGDHAGHVTVVKVSLPSPPQVVESFHVCESNILCGVYVERTCGEEKKFKGTMSGRFGFPFPTVWLGTQGGRYSEKVWRCLACVTVASSLNDFSEALLDELTSQPIYIARVKCVSSSVKRSNEIAYYPPFFSARGGNMISRLENGSVRAQSY